MDDFNSLKKELLAINADLLAVFERLTSVPGVAAEQFAGWNRICRAVVQQLPEEILRLAVVGSIKSGKSTFINSLFQGDYLKRGAGVVTSIVTKIRAGSRLNAKLFFKFWDDINAEIQQALALFPASMWRDDQQHFEIRRQKERQALRDALASLGTDVLFKDGTRNINSILLDSYLKGFDRIKDLLTDGSLIQEYTGEDFFKHTEFVADDALAVYLKDIQLEVDFKGLDPDIEIADCQGSDSPNPLHLAMIQDYLTATHLIVYVISSRTGIRQADIRFLSLIQKMGILDNILFVVNCDFSEHTGLSDLQRLVERVQEDLALLTPHARVYAFSALYNLFQSPNMHLDSRDRLRLEQWRQDAALPAFADQEFSRFKEVFLHTLSQERYALLLTNHLERLGIVISGLTHWIRLNREILSRDTEGARRMMTRLEQHQTRMAQIRSLVRSTLDGAIVQIKQKAKIDLDRFFDERRGSIVPPVIAFIRQYAVAFEEYEEQIEKVGFARTLYFIFQEFKQRLDTYLTENMHPEVIQYIQGKEQDIKVALESIVEPFNAMVQEALQEYNQTLDTLGVPSISQPPAGLRLAEMDHIKALAGLRMPPVQATMRYSAHIKTEAVMHLGFLKLTRIFRRLLRQPPEVGRAEERRALAIGVKRMKREIEKSVVFQLKDYRENVKFQYLLKLMDYAANSLDEALRERFQTYATDLSKSVGLLDETRLSKTEASRVLTETQETASGINDRLKAIRQTLVDMRMDQTG